MRLIREYDEAVLLLGAGDHDFFVEGVLDLEMDAAYIECRYRNPELEGIWIFRRPLDRRIAIYLVATRTVELHPAHPEEAHLYRLVR